MESGRQTITPSTPAPVLPDVRWFHLYYSPASNGVERTLWCGGADEKWASLREVARALGASPKSLTQWMAPHRDFKTADVSDRLRVVPFQDLPSGMKARRGLRMIAASAVEEYVQTVQRRRGQNGASA
jgi:hypothetical protein